MRRLLAAVVVFLLVVLVAPLTAVAQSGSDREAIGASWGKGLDYDIDRVRAAQKRAVERVGPMPADIAEYFEDKPSFLAHSRNPHFDLEDYIHENVPGFAEMQARLRDHLAARTRAMVAETQAVGEPVVFRIPAILFRIHDDEWLPDSTPEHFEALLSGTGSSPTGTVTEVYLEQSFGNMVIEIDVYGPYDSIVSNNPLNDCHYGTEGAPITGDVLGLGGLGARGMAVEAVPQTYADIDWGQYDNTLDGMVDFLLMIHSGPDAAATGDPCHVWSHYFGDLAGEPTVPTLSTNAEGVPVMIGPVMTVPEVDLQIGVTAHEIMHALGEPDYYGTAGTAGTGDWDLGAGGSWSGVPAQTNPVHFNPVMKINFGWIEPTRIDETALDQVLRPRASYPDLLQVPIRIARAGTSEADLCDQAPVGIPGQNNTFYTDDGDCLVEGFLIENLHRASAGWSDDSCVFLPADFDRQAYASGLMVWHWDFVSYRQLGNDDVMRPMLQIQEFNRRTGLKDLVRNVTRGAPPNLYWGDPVGLSGATEISPDEASIDPPPGSPWSVTAAPGLGVEGTEAQPIPEWEAAAAPEGAGMTVALTWDVPTDDWDLYVDQLVDGEWVEVRSSAAGAPQTEERVTIFDFSEGDRFRARAYNWLGPTTPQAEVSVSYELAGLTQLGPSGTRNNDLEQTGWAITNIRPNTYRGLAHAADLPRTPITVDLVRHDETTVDVSPDFLRIEGDPVPVIAGTPLTLTTPVYNHGGRPVAGASFALYAADPATGAAPIAEVTRDLEGFDRQMVEFTVTPSLGLNEYWVHASAPGDITPGNDVVRTEVRAYPAGAPVLIVDNDFGWTQEETYEAHLNAAGVSYAVVDGEPSADVLSEYDAVIWLTTTVSGADGVLSADGQQAITDYLEGGGRLWLATTRVAGYLGAPTGDPEWLAEYFGFGAEGNLLDSMGTATGLGAAIGGEREVELGYLDGRPYLDYGTVPDASDVRGSAAGLFAHAERPDRVIATQVDGDDGFRTVFGIPLGLVNGAAAQHELFTEVADFLGIATGVTQPEAMTVRFERFMHVQVGEDWPVTVGAVAPDGVDAVRFVHRPYGAVAWERLPLTEVAAGLWGGTIPASAIANNGLEYFVEVVSGGSTLQVDGGEDLPNVASAPYGDPADVAYCPEAVGDEPLPAPDPPLPATGGGIAIAAAALLGAALLRRLRA